MSTFTCPAFLIGVGVRKIKESFVTSKWIINFVYHSTLTLSGSIMKMKNCWFSASSSHVGHITLDPHNSNHSTTSHKDRTSHLQIPQCMEIDNNLWQLKLVQKSLDQNYQHWVSQSISKFSSCSINFSKADECDAISPPVSKTSEWHLHAYTNNNYKKIYQYRHKIT